MNDSLRLIENKGWSILLKKKKKKSEAMLHVDVRSGSLPLYLPPSPPASSSSSSS